MKQYKHAKQIEIQHMNNSWQTENGDRMFRLNSSFSSTIPVVVIKHLSQTLTPTASRFP